MVRDRGLGKAHLLDNLIDRKPTAAALAHDLLAGLVSNGFCKKDRVHIHRRLSIWDYIEVCLFVKAVQNAMEAKNLKSVKMHVDHAIIVMPGRNK